MTKRDPITMNEMKYTTIHGFDHDFGCMSIPAVSTPRNITPAHPSPVVKMNKVLMA